MGSTSIAFDSATRAGLLLQARKGDRESLAKLILPYGPALYLGALRLTRNPAEAEDVRQEAFLKPSRDWSNSTGAKKRRGRFARLGVSHRGERID